MGVAVTPEPQKTPLCQERIIPVKQFQPPMGAGTCHEFPGPMDDSKSPEAAALWDLEEENQL